MVHVFFFFKQKTAYEMRISDWSSDGCSSDLSALHRSHRCRRQCGQDHDLPDRLCRYIRGHMLWQLGEHRLYELDRSVRRKLLRFQLEATVVGRHWRQLEFAVRPVAYRYRQGAAQPARRRDRKSVASGKSVSVRVDLGGRRIIKKK